MTSSSSLYGSVTTQNSSSTNSTSLYGEAGTPIPDSSGNVIVRGDLYVLSGNILTTATTGNIFPANATTINLGLAATAVNIGAATGSTTINNTLFAPGADFGNITIGVATDNTITTTTGNLVLKSAGGEIDTDTTNTLSTNNASFFLLNSPTTVNAFQGATTLAMGAATGTTTINNDLTVDGTNINIAQATSILYSESNDRLNRPTVQSSTGNTTGLRVAAPNTGTSSQGLFSVTNSSDIANTEFLQMGARGSALTNTFRFLTGQYVGGVQSATNKSVAFTDYLNTYATVNPAGPTIGTDLATKTYVDSLPGGGVSSITGTANQVIVSSPTGAITLSLPQSIATTSNVTFADITATDDLTVQGNNVNLAQATTIGYDENNDRDNRPQVQSTSGDASGFRVLAPNATTSANSNLTVFSSNDVDNGEFLNLRASGSTTAPFSVRTGKYTAGVLGASGEEINFIDNTTTYASVNPAGPTNGTDLTTKTYVDAAVAGGVTSITGTANQVIASSSTGAVTLSLPQSIATTSNVTFADVIVGDDLTVQGNNVNLAQVTTIGYNENNDRTNRPQVQSTSGNASGLRITAPNATTSAQSNLTVFATNDIDNGEFLSLRASGSTTAPFSIRTGLYTAGVLGASGEEINFIDNTTTYASVNPAGPTNGTDLTTKAYVDAIVIDNTTYTIDASATTGGANFNLVGTNSTTDTVKFAEGAGIDIVQTDANTITVASTITQYTDALARLAISGTAPIGYDNTTGVITFTPTFTAGSLLAGSGTAWVDSITGIGNQYNLNRNSTGATGNNNILVLTKTRTDGARTNGQGPFQIFNYTGTDGGYNFARLSTGYQSGGTHTINFATSTDTTGAFGTGTTTLLTLGTGGTTLSTGGAYTLNRTSAVAASPSGQILRLSRTDVTGPQDADGIDFRLSVGGTATTSNFARFDGIYRSSGLNEIGMSVSTDSFSADVDRIYIGTRESTKIQTTPAGGGTTSTTAQFTQLDTTIKSDALTLQTAAAAALPGGKISYGRQYINAYSTVNQTNPVANAENLMIFGTTDINNGISIVTNGTALTRITFANAGLYNLQFSAQLSQTAGGADNAFIWLKKNGTAVANTAGDTRVAGNGDRIMAAWNYVFSAAAGDYYELAWAATDTTVILEYVAAAAPVPAVPSVILTVVPVGA